MAVPETVIEVEFTRLKTLSYLTIEPELIAPGIQSYWLTILAGTDAAVRVRNKYADLGIG